MDIRSICFGVGDRFTIPQWEHTQHNGFAEVIKIGVGYRLGKILIRWPDLSESWDSTRPSTGLGYGFRDGTYEFLVRGQGVVGPIRDFWVVGEMEYKYCKNWDRLMGRERRFCGRSN